jgi:hypothetical protein
MKKVLSILLLSIMFIGCDVNSAPQKETTNSGVSANDAKANLVVKKQANGMTLEQSNIVKSYEVENRPGAIKHLYVISPYSGKVLIYSTVAGKVTSSVKGLNPSTVSALDGQTVSSSHYGMPVTVHGREKYTEEVMNESGTYGTSRPEFIYWWDTKGIYHQHYVTGGQMIHVSDQPMPVREIVIDMNLAGVEK